jgi:hypothetical protein
MAGPVNATRVRTALILAAALAVGAALPGTARAQHNGGGSHGGGGGWHGGGGGWHGGGGGWHGGGWHGGNWWWGPGIAAGVFAGAALADTYGYGYPYGYGDPSPYDYPPSQYAAPGYAPTASSAAYWYYCQNPAGYYPYVQRCRTQWQPVPMQPPG